MYGVQVLAETSPLLADMILTVQEPLNVACSDVRTDGMGCIWDASQVAAGAPHVPSYGLVPAWTLRRFP